MLGYWKWSWSPIANMDWSKITNKSTNQIFAEAFLFEYSAALCKITLVVELFSSNLYLPLPPIGLFYNLTFSSCISHATHTHEHRIQVFEFTTTQTICEQKLITAGNMEQWTEKKDLKERICVDDFLLCDHFFPFINYLEGCVRVKFRYEFDSDIVHTSIRKKNKSLELDRDQVIRLCDDQWSVISLFSFIEKEFEYFSLSYNV